MTKDKKAARGPGRVSRGAQTREPDTAAEADAPETKPVAARPRTLPKSARVKIAVGRQMVEEPDQTAQAPAAKTPQRAKKAAAKRTEKKPAKTAAAKPGMGTPEAGASSKPAKPSVKPKGRAAMPPSNGSTIPSYADVTVSRDEAPAPQPQAAAMPKPVPAPEPAVKVEATRAPAPAPAAPQEAVDSFRQSLAAAGRGAAAVNCALIDMARDSVNAELDLFAALAGARSPAQALRLHMAFWEGRVQALQAQARSLQAVSAEAMAATAAPICAHMRRSLSAGAP